MIYKAINGLSSSFIRQLDLDITILARLKNVLVESCLKLDLADKEYMNRSVINMVSTCRFIYPFRNIKLYTVGFLDFVLEERRKHLVDSKGQAWEEYFLANL